MSIWQTKPWGEMLKKSKQAEEIFEINGIFIEKRKVSIGEYGLFVLGLEKKISKKDFNELIILCKKENCLFFQFETLKYNNLPFSKGVPEGGGILKEGYYKKFITPYTAVIDLTKHEDEILANMKPKGRYNIKLAKKKGVEIKEVEKTDKNIQEYYNLLIETTSRDNFNGNSLKYYKTFLKTLKQSKLLLAFFEDKIIAGGIFVFDKDVSIYYYGASTSNKKYRNIMAPYLLQWEAIKIAKGLGSTLYDFLGVANPDEKNSSLSGVTDFKKKLTKDIRKVSFSYLWINKNIKYKLIILIKFLRKIFFKNS